MIRGKGSQKLENKKFALSTSLFFVHSNRGKIEGGFTFLVYLNAFSLDVKEIYFNGKTLSTIRQEYSFTAVGIFIERIHERPFPITKLFSFSPSN